MIKLRVWRQDRPDARGVFKTYEVEADPQYVVAGAT